MSKDDSDERLEAWLLELENQDLADRRAELSGDRWLSLIHDPRASSVYIFRHGMDETEGAAVPADAEIWEFDSFERAERAYAALLGEAAAAGELVDPESEAEELGDVETDGLNAEELHADTDDLDDEEETQDVDALLEQEDITGGEPD
ncbi:MAG TPA: hypothetical protein VIA06_16955 [Candidatus Dormibacteraeota bacterium]|nr:hypothetical protein [Candidatus Dormibacteraeota bacterium]